MAISFVAATGQAADTATYTTSWTITKPTGTVAGDLMVCCVTDGDEDFGEDDLFLPTGWTQLEKDFSSAGGNGWALVGYRVFQSGDPDTWTDGARSTTSDVICIVTSSYRGVDTSTPVLDSIIAKSTAASVSSGNVNNTSANNWAIGTGHYVDTTVDSTSISGDPTTLRDQVRELDSGNAAGVGLWDSNGTVGTGNRQFTFDSGGSDVGWACVIVIVAAAEAAIPHRSYLVTDQAIVRSNFW